MSIWVGFAARLQKYAKRQTRVSLVRNKCINSSVCYLEWNATCVKFTAQWEVYRQYSGMNEEPRVITCWFAVTSYCPLACLASFQRLEAPVKYTASSIRSMLNNPNFLPKFCPDCPSYIYSELSLRRIWRNHDTNLLVLWEALPKQESAARPGACKYLASDGQGSRLTME